VDVPFDDTGSMRESRPTPRWPRWIARMATTGPREFLVLLVGGILLIFVLTVIVKAATGNL